MNKISVDLHAALLGAGFYTPIGYWTVELSLDAVGGVNLPKSLVEFTKQGSRATAYEMGGLSVGTDLSVTLSAGYSRRITDELTVGGRINFIGGLASFTTMIFTVYRKLGTEPFDLRKERTP